MTSTMKDSLVVFLEGAKVNFRLFGHLVPVFAAVLDGEPQIMGVVWTDPSEKEAFAQKVQQWISEGRLTEFIMVAEAWTADATDLSAVRDYLSEKGSLESWPGRREVVMVTYCGPSEEIECTAEINRGTIGLPTLGDWSQVSRRVSYNPLDFSARFQGMFLKGKAQHN